MNRGRRKTGYDIAFEQVEQRLDVEHRIMGDILVLLKYKYDHEKEYDIEWHVLLWENEEFIWEDDWCEGQTDVTVLKCGYVTDIKDISFYG